MARASGDKHTEATPATTQTREKIRSITNIPKIRARPEAGGSVASKKPSKPLLQTENSRMIDGAPVASTSQASRQHLDPLGLPLRSPLPSSKGSISSSRPPSALKTPSASSSARKSSIRSNRSHASPLPPRSQSKQSASIEDLLETSYASFMNTSDSPVSTPWL